MNGEGGLLPLRCEVIYDQKRRQQFLGIDVKLGLLRHSLTTHANLAAASSAAHIGGIGLDDAVRGCRRRWMALP